MTASADFPLTAAPSSQPWWSSAVVYQVYPRSFADADGDGIGDIDGIRSHLDYLAGLGIDAIWINPWYPSPMADAGYDVSDYRDIEPIFGTLAGAEALIGEAHDRGLKVILDIVPNHTSDQHRWFAEALAAGPGSAARDRYYFRDGRGEAGELPPNDWASEFGGGAWTRITEADGTPGQWYLHLFAAGQPDVNWENPDVPEEFEHTLRFWFDRGVDGFRIDVAHGLVKDPTLRDIGDLAFPLPQDTPTGIEHPHWDQPGVHEIFRAWRRVAESYDPPRAFCGEIWVGRDDRLVAYLRPDELHTAFNFNFLTAPWRYDALSTTIRRTLDAHAAVGAPATWVLGNHDVCRPVSRYARPQEGLSSSARNLSHFIDRPADLTVGTRRARAAALLSLALPGGAYIYQGEELGLPEVEDIPDDQLQDPAAIGTGFADRGRDGCRVPLPWSTSGANAGFSPAGAQPGWLPQPAGWAQYSAEQQQGRAGSSLELYRTALALRRTLPALGAGDLSWVDAGENILAFDREPGFSCWVNLSTEPIAVPESAKVLVASDSLNGDRLPPDTCVWLQHN